MIKLQKHETLKDNIFELLIGMLPYDKTTFVPFLIPMYKVTLTFTSSFCHTSHFLSSGFSGV